MIYLDNNATTAVKDDVRHVMIDALNMTGNPSSVHRAGREARAALERARKQVAALAGADPVEVIFTSGATEANNLALSGWPNNPAIFVSAIEHDSVLDCVPEAQHIPVDTTGQVRLDALETALKQQVPGKNMIVSVMYANNETGVIQPIEKIRKITRQYNCFLHVDAVQAAGKIALDFKGLDLDAMSLSAHKIGGPKGVGCLILKEGLTLQAQIRGGGQEKKRRCGTENLAGIVGFGKAAELAENERVSEWDRLSMLRHQIEAEITTHQDLPVQILGRNSPRTPNVTNLILPGVPSETQVMSMDLAGVAVSAGSACSSGKVKMSHVLVAMGLDDNLSGASLRISLGWQNSKEDVDAFLAAYCKMARRFASR